MRSPTETYLTIRSKLHAKQTAIKQALSSRTAFLEALQVSETAHGRAPSSRSFWKNEDLDLTPRSQWTWGWYDFAAFWWSYGFSVGVWSVGSSMVSVGLNAWQCSFFTDSLLLNHLLLQTKKSGD